MTEQVQQKREMTEQENECVLDELEWIERHGVKFLQAVLWELGLDEEPEETLIEVLASVHERTELYVFDLESARSYVKDSYQDQWAQCELQNARALISARQERIKARRKRKLEAMDDDDPLPW